MYALNKIADILPIKNTFISLIVLFALITIIGMVGSKLIASPINALFKKILDKAPLLKTIYSSVKDLMNTFFGNKKGFDQAVLVKIYDNSSIERFGFITNDDLQNLNINSDKVLVYIPHSLTFSGNVFLVDKKNLTPIDTPSRDIMKLIVSGEFRKLKIKIKFEDKNPTKHVKEFHHTSITSALHINKCPKPW